MLDRFRLALKKIEWREFALKPGHCPLCGVTLYVRLFNGDFGVRCARCGSAQNTLALVSVVKELMPDISRRRVHLVSMRGPYFNWLERHAGELWISQYFDNVESGSEVNGVRCEDLQRLTYQDETFDLVTNSEVLEHVPDDAKAFSEILRILKPGGLLVFTVPLAKKQAQTLERAVLSANGEIRLLAPAEYHGDPVRGRILAFRSYGTDIVDRIQEAGFVRARIESDFQAAVMSTWRSVVVAKKPFH